MAQQSTESINTLSSKRLVEALSALFTWRLISTGKNM